MRFVNCPLDMCKNYRYNHDKTRPNDPINLEVIERFSKSRDAYYPDNQGIPIIVFYKDGKAVHSWRFDTDEQRDNAFIELTGYSR